MSIEFSSKRWDKIKEDYAAWWDGSLERPLIPLTVQRPAPERPEPAIAFEGNLASYDKSVPAEDVIDTWDHAIAHQRFLGDAFPTMWLNFGPGVLSAFMGAQLEAREGTSWFHPPAVKELTDLHFAFDADSPWYQRVRDVARAGAERWGGIVQIGMSDLGGNLDILSTFRPSELLHFDICCSPEEVKRLIWEAHDAWWTCFEALNRELQPANPGYTSWVPIFSETPMYMLQCDFAYMIGPDMFDEFVKPELEASCARLGHAFYHLDGVGQLPHLDSLLAMDELDGVQWVPGAGQPDWDQWPEVYAKIREAGKLVQIFGDLATLDSVVDQLGTGKGIILIPFSGVENEKVANDFLEKYGAA